MNNIVQIYNDFYMKGDIESFINSLDAISVDTSVFKNRQSITEKQLNAINCIVSYLEIYGLDIQTSDGRYLTDLVSNERSELRFVITQDLIDVMLSEMSDSKSFPAMKFGCNTTQFNERFMFEIYEEEFKSENIMYKSLMTYIIGFPADSMESIAKLKSEFVSLDGMTEAVGFVNIGEDWFNNILIQMYNFGVSFMDWCTWFDGMWFDISNQLSSGFVTLPRESSSGVDFVVCISTLYIGEYFICSYRMFTVLYNNDFLSTIRFADKEVCVEHEDGSVTSKVVLVPIYFDGNEEHLVSEIVDKNFVYAHNALRDVGSWC